MKTSKLTQAAIKKTKYSGRALKRGQSRDFRWDSDPYGFGVRVYPSGRKAFVLSYRLHGRKRLMTLGDFGTLTLDEARRKAKKHLIKIDDGHDPLEDRESQARAGTVRELIDDYVEHRRTKKKAKTADAMKRRLERNTPRSWMGRKAASITGRDIAARHVRIGEQGIYEANRYLELVRAMFNLALGDEIGRHYLPRDGENPTVGIKKFRETKRKQWITPAQLPALARAIDAEPNIYVRGALWLYLLTGARKTELLAAKRTDVDWSLAVLRLPDTKSGEEQEVSLSGPAVAILQSLSEIDGNRHLFPGAREKGHLVNINKPWTRIRQRATMEVWQADRTAAAIIAEERARLSRTPVSKHAPRRTEPTVAEVLAAAERKELELPQGFLQVRIHDLRRTVGSWMTRAKVDLNTIKGALRHQSISTTLTYARLGEEPARDALEEHGRRIMEIAGKSRVAGGSED